MVCSERANTLISLFYDIREIPWQWGLVGFVGALKSALG